LYGKLQTVEYKTYDAQWYRACGPRLLRVVVVRLSEGQLRLRVFFCTDITLSVRKILEGYAERWAIEVCFRDLKQLLGFADSSARKQAAVERTPLLLSASPIRSWSSGRSAAPTDSPCPSLRCARGTATSAGSPSQMSSAPPNEC